MRELKIGDKVSYELAMGGTAEGELVGMRNAGGGLVIYIVRTSRGHECNFLRADLTYVAPKAPKKVRPIVRKLTDIAEAAWEQGDAGSDSIGDLAEKRIARLKDQMEKLAVLAIQGKLMLSDARMAEVVAHSTRDEILAEALVGNWTAVSDLVNTALHDAEQATYRASLRIRDGLEA